MLFDYLESDYSKNEIEFYQQDKESKDKSIDEFYKYYKEIEKNGWKSPDDSRKYYSFKQHFDYLNSDTYKKNIRLANRMCQIKKFGFKNNNFWADIVLRDNVNFTIIQNFTSEIYEYWRSYNGMYIKILDAVSGFELKECQEDPELHIEVSEIYSAHRNDCHKCCNNDICIYYRVERILKSTVIPNDYCRTFADCEVDVSSKMPKILAIDTAEWHSRNELFAVDDSSNFSSKI